MQHQEATAIAGAAGLSLVAVTDMSVTHGQPRRTTTTR